MKGGGRGEVVGPMGAHRRSPLSYAHRRRTALGKEEEQSPLRLVVGRLLIVTVAGEGTDGRDARRGGDRSRCFPCLGREEDDRPRGMLEEDAHTLIMYGQPKHGTHQHAGVAIAVSRHIRPAHESQSKLVNGPDVRPPPGTCAKLRIQLYMYD